MKKYETEISKITVYVYTAEAESEADFFKKARENCENGPDYLDENPEIDYVEDFISIGSSIRESDIEGETKEERVFRVSRLNR